MARYGLQGYGAIKISDLRWFGFRVGGQLGSFKSNVLCRHLRRSQNDSYAKKGGRKIDPKYYNIFCIGTPKKILLGFGTPANVCPGKTDDT